MTLEQLRDRLKAATGPDRELDARLYAMAVYPDWTFVPARYPGGMCRVTKGHDERLAEAPHYTASLDGAVGLAPDESWGVSWDIESVHAMGFPGNVGVVAYVWLHHPTNEASFCRSPACVDFKAAIKHVPRLIALARVEYELAKAGRNA